MDLPIDGQEFAVMQADLEGIIAPPAGPLDVEVGYTYTTVPADEEDSHELFAEAAYPALLTPRVLLVRDVDALNALYGEFGLAREVPFADQPVEFEVVAGVDNGFLDVGDELVLSHVATNVRTEFFSRQATIEVFGGLQYSVHSTYQDVSGDFPVVLGAHVHL